MLVNSYAERRRLERALHDGAQSRLAAVTATLGLAHKKLAAGDDDAAALVELAGVEARRCLEDLRELAREIYPAVVAERGLAAALNDLARRAPGVVDVAAAPAERMPEPAEVAAYLVAAEVLAYLPEDGEASLAAWPESGAVIVEATGVELPADEIDSLAERLGVLGGWLETNGSRHPLVRVAIPLEDLGPR
jgi:hypothetical protein